MHNLSEWNGQAIHQCLEKRMRRVLSRDNDRWVLECSGSTTPHKLPQDDGSLLCHQGFCQGGSAISILLLTDNISVVAHIKIGGTKSPRLTSQVKDLWEQCLQKQITVTAQHLPCLENVTADYLSRHLTDSTDWMLNPNIFQCLDKIWGPLQVDLFATRFTR